MLNRSRRGPDKKCDMSKKVSLIDVVNSECSIYTVQLACCHSLFMHDTILNRGG